jgi:hypothetical protein
MEETIRAILQEDPVYKFAQELMAQAEAMEDQPGSESLGSPEGDMGGPPPGEPPPEGPPQEGPPPGDEQVSEEVKRRSRFRRPLDVLLVAIPLSLVPIVSGSEK